jgi:uncharacterized phage infection (PIP) family protein YhgE
MRRLVFLVLGVLEVIVGLLLVSLGLQVPGTQQVDSSFQSAQRVTDRAGSQVQLLRQQVHSVRRMELQQLATRLQKQTRTVTATLRSQRLDFETVRGMRDGMAEDSHGLDTLADSLDGDGLARMGKGLGETASFLDQRVIPSAGRAADHLDASTALLGTDAQRLEMVLRETPHDLKAVREVYRSLSAFQAGLDKLNQRLDGKRLAAMREGFQGLEDSLRTGADQVDLLADRTYPVVTFDGLVPEINERPFWPEGSRIAKGMRKAAAGATAASKEMEGLAKDLPQIRASLTESSTMLARLRETLGAALEHQDKIEPLLKEAPAHAAQLSTELPRVSGELSRVLRDTDRLKEMAQGLRQAQKGLDQAAANWPQVRTMLRRLAGVLKATGDQLDQAVKHRAEYEAASQQTVELADSFATLLPMVTDQIDTRLEEQEQTLDDLGQSLGEVNAALPAYNRTTQDLLQTGRLLAWLAAAIVGLHGCYLILSARMGRRYSL